MPTHVTVVEVYEKMIDRESVYEMLLAQHQTIKDMADTQKKAYESSNFLDKFSNLIDSTGIGENKEQKTG